MLDENIGSLTQRSDRIITKECASAELAVALAQMISDTNVSLRERFESWGGDLVESHDHLMIDFRNMLVEQIQDVSLLFNRASRRYLTRVPLSAGYEGCTDVYFALRGYCSRRRRSRCARATEYHVFEGTH